MADYHNDWYLFAEKSMVTPKLVCSALSCWHPSIEYRPHALCCAQSEARDKRPACCPSPSAAHVLPTSPQHMHRGCNAQHCLPHIPSVLIPGIARCLCQACLQHTSSSQHFTPLTLTPRVTSLRPPRSAGSGCGQPAPYAV